MNGTLAGSDSLQIMALAQLCPEINGNVVYQARALYSFIYNDLSIFNDDSCISADTTYIAERHSAPLIRQANNGNSIQQYVLHPNPSDGNIYLQQLIPDQKAVVAQIWTATGASVFRDNLYFVNGVDQLHLVNAVPGLYLLQLTDSNGKVFTLKFVVE